MKMTGTEILKLVLLALVSGQFLYYIFISSNLYNQAKIFIPLYNFYILVYVIYNEIGLEYLIIPTFILHILSDLLIYFKLSTDYYNCHGDHISLNKNMTYKSILLIIVLLYIFQNKKCNLSKVVMIFLVITFIQAYIHIYSDEKKQENMTNNIENEDKKNEENEEDNEENEED